MRRPLPRLSVPEGDHPARDLAVSALHPEPARRRGAAGRARHRRHLRDGPGLGRALRAADRQAPAAPAWPPSSRWHLDEMFVKIAGRTDVSVAGGRQRGRGPRHAGPEPSDKRAALRLMRKLLKNQGMAPEELVTDRLRAYGARPGSSASAPSTSRASARTTGRKVACPDPAARAEDAGLPLARLGSTLPCRSRRRRQHLHHLPPPDLCCHPSPASSRGLCRVARGCGACGVIGRGGWPDTPSCHQNRARPFFALCKERRCCQPLSPKGGGHLVGSETDRLDIASPRTEELRLTCRARETAGPWTSAASTPSRRQLSLLLLIGLGPKIALVPFLEKTKRMSPEGSAPLAG